MYSTMKQEKTSKRLYTAPTIELMEFCGSAMLAGTETRPISVNENGEIQSGGPGSPNTATSKEWPMALGDTFDKDAVQSTWGNLWTNNDSY